MVGPLFVVEVPVVALASLIIITKNAPPTDDVR